MIWNSALRIILCLISLHLLMPAHAAAQQVSLTVRFTFDDVARTGSKFTIVLNGAPLKFLRPSPEIINEQLNFGNQYLLEFEKPGFVKKTIVLNTANVPQEVQKGGLNLTLSVRLESAGNSATAVGPVTYVYDTKAKGFLEQKRTEVVYQQGGENRKRAEELFDLITKEEEKERQYKQHFIKEDALEGRKGEFSKKEELTEEQKAAEEERKAEVIRKAEEQRAARVAQIEEQRKAMMSEEERKTSETITKREEQQRKQIAELKSKEEERKVYERKMEEQTRAEAEARQAEEERRLKEAASKQAEEERRRQEAAAKADIEKRKREAREKFQQEQGGQAAKPAQAAEERPMTIKEAGNIVSRTEEIIQEDKRIIRQITIKRERHTFVYRQVKHDWGGVFFFKNDIDITKNDFEMETALDK